MSATGLAKWARSNRWQESVMERGEAQIYNSAVIHSPRAESRFIIDLFRVRLFQSSDWVGGNIPLVKHQKQGTHQNIGQRLESIEKQLKTAY